MFLVRVVACALLAAGCATVSGTRQYVSLDSQPRGLEVTDADQEVVLGKTPLFVHLERERTHTFRVRAPGETPTTAKMKCRYRWGGSAVANVPVGLASVVPLCWVPAWAGAVGVDLASGAAWDCPDSFLIPTPETWTAPATCPVYAVAVPRHEDEQIARLVVQGWTERFKQGGACGRVVPQEDVDLALERFGFDHETGLDLEELPRGRLNEVGFRTGATHLVTFSLPTDREVLNVSPAIHELHTLKVEPDAPLDVDISVVTKKNPVLRWLAGNVKLLPNAVAFAPSIKEFEFAPRGATTGPISDQRAASVLPSVLGNWTVGFMQHPSRHGAWGLSGGLGPGAFVGYNKRSLGIPRGDVSAQADVTAVHLIGLYSASLALHTPLGAFSGALGLGVGGAMHWSGEQYVNTAIRGYGFVEVGWTGFLTDRVFVRLTGTRFQPSSAELEGRGYALTGWQQASLTLGVYLPGVRSRVRALF